MSGRQVAAATPTVDPCGGRGGALVIEGYASLWGVADLNGDVVARGAFDRSVAAAGARGVRMLHQHEGRSAIGVWDELREDDRGLWVRDGSWTGPQKHGSRRRCPGLAPWTACRSVFAAREPGATDGCASWSRSNCGKCLW